MVYLENAQDCIVFMAKDTVRLSSRCSEMEQLNTPKTAILRAKDSETELCQSL
jgi:hypothetical protein